YLPVLKLVINSRLLACEDWLSALPLLKYVRVFCDAVLESHSSRLKMLQLITSFDQLDLRIDIMINFIKVSFFNPLPTGSVAAEPFSFAFSGCGTGQIKNALRINTQR